MRYRLFFVLAILAGTQTLASHPHVFVEPGARLVFSGRQLVRIDVDFLFDTMTSRGIIEAFDQNRNGRLDPAELAVIRTKAIPGLAEYGFFTQIRVDGAVLPIRGTGADVRLHAGGKVSYLFSIPVGRHVAREVRFWFADPTIFTAFDIKASRMSLAGAPAGAGLGESRDADTLRIVVRL